MSAATDVAAPAGAGDTGKAASRRRGNPFGRLYRGETHYDFVGRTRWWFLLSGIVILSGLVSLGTRGLNFGIDFLGGSSWQVQVANPNVGAVRSALDGVGLKGATIEVLGHNQLLGSKGKPTVLVQDRATCTTTTALTTLQATVDDALGHALHVDPNSISTSCVGPTWGAQITRKAVEALIVFFIGIALFIAVVFEMKMALAAMIAVVHDILVTVGVYSLSGFQVTPDTVVAFLTILGYSLYDTMVVFDRVRDNLEGVGVAGRHTVSAVVNLSMNQVLARSINTSLVAILPIMSVLFLGADVFGATTLQYFGLALFVGLVTGAYSSIFIASPILAKLKEREPRHASIRQRLHGRGEVVAVATAALPSAAEARVAAAARVRGGRPAPRPGRGGPGGRGGDAARGGPRPDLLRPGAGRTPTAGTPPDVSARDGDGVGTDGTEEVAAAGGEEDGAGKPAATPVDRGGASGPNGSVERGEPGPVRPKAGRTRKARSGSKRRR